MDRQNMRNEDRTIETGAALAQARALAIGLHGFPIMLPDCIEDAYAVQRHATAIWPDSVSGWKVGRISADTRLKEDRFVGPIFRRTVMRHNTDGLTPFIVFPQGSAALEAELLVVLANDLAPNKTDWTAASAAAEIATVHIGIEVAGSPIAEIAALGPLASIAAFGNNAGLIVGQEVTGGLDAAVHVTCVTLIDGKEVGRSVAANIPGGPATALAFALSRLARLDITLPAGTIIATGAITGVHPITLGQTGIADFGSLGAIAIKTVAALSSKQAGSSPQ
jgi:2-keto-4-pentenoate hydratase